MPRHAARRETLKKLEVEKGAAVGGDAGRPEAADEVVAKVVG